MADDQVYDTLLVISYLTPCNACTKVLKDLCKYHHAVNKINRDRYGDRNDAKCVLLFVHQYENYNMYQTLDKDFEMPEQGYEQNPNDLLFTQYRFNEYDELARRGKVNEDDSLLENVNDNTQWALVHIFNDNDHMVPQGSDFTPMDEEYCIGPRVWRSNDGFTFIARIDKIEKQGEYHTENVILQKYKETIYREAIEWNRADDAREETERARIADKRRENARRQRLKRKQKGKDEWERDLEYAEKQKKEEECRQEAYKAAEDTQNDEIIE
eukprot:167714_1